MKAIRHLILVTFAMCIFGCASSPPVPRVSADTNRALAIRFLDALDRQDWAALDQMVTLDYKHHVVTGTGFSEKSWEAFRKGNQAAHAASPDWKNTPIQMIVEGDRVAILLAGHGTHTGSFGGESPSGKTMDLPVAVFLQFREGKVAADWEVADAAPLMRTLSQP